MVGGRTVVRLHVAHEHACGASEIRQSITPCQTIEMSLPEQRGQMYTIGRLVVVSLHNMLQRSNRMPPIS